MSGNETEAQRRVRIKRIADECTVLIQVRSGNRTQYMGTGFVVDLSGEADDSVAWIVTDRQLVDRLHEGDSIHYKTFLGKGSDKKEDAELVTGIVYSTCVADCGENHVFVLSTTCYENVYQWHIIALQHGQMTHTG